MADKFLKTLEYSRDRVKIGHNGYLYLFIDETLGIVSALHTESLSNLSLISQAKIDGQSVLYLEIF